MFIKALFQSSLQEIKWVKIYNYKYKNQTLQYQQVGLVIQNVWTVLNNKKKKILCNKGTLVRKKTEKN